MANLTRPQILGWTERWKEDPKTQLVSGNGSIGHFDTSLSTRPGEGKALGGGPFLLPLVGP